MFRQPLSTSPSAPGERAGPDGAPAAPAAPDMFMRTHGRGQRYGKSHMVSIWLARAMLAQYMPSAA